EGRSRSGRGGGAEPVARVVVGEDERLASRAARAEVGGGGGTGVMVEGDDARAREAEGGGDEGEARARAGPELARRGRDGAELGPPLPHLLLEGRARRGPRHAVVLLDVGLVVEHTIEPLARGGPGTGQGHEVDLGRRDAALAEQRIDGEARVACVILESGEALLGGASHDPTVLEERRGSAVGLVDAEDDHVSGIISGRAALPNA